jgi:hypothetical protein
MSDAGAANGEVVSTLTEYWEELVLAAPVSPAERLLDVGGNSLIATMLGNRIELTWGIRPSLEELLTFSFGELSGWCSEHLPA